VVVPIEDRVGLDCMKPVSSFREFIERGVAGPDDISCSDVIAAYKVRIEMLSLPEWRNISRLEELLFKVYCSTVDKIVTIFRLISDKVCGVQDGN
jgi:hypothetical protein